MTVPDALCVPEIPGAWYAIAPFSDPDPALLTTDERMLFEQLSGSHRPREWFAGRLAGRGALRAVGAGATSILRDERGAPLLYGPHANHAMVALTHGQSFAAAIAIPKAAPYPHIGIDWVDARDGARLERLSTRFLTSSERELSTRDPNIRLVCWGVREAAAKATLTGMFAFGLSRVWLTRIDPGLEHPTINLPGARATVRWQPDGAALIMVGLDHHAFDSARNLHADPVSK